MPVAHVQAVGNAPSAATSLTRTITSGVTTTPGNMLSIVGRGAGGCTITAVSDGRGNTWQVDLASPSGQSCTSVASCIVAAGKQIVPGDIITITLSAAVNVEIACDEFSGVAVSGGLPVVDQSNNTHNSAAGAVTAATTVNSQAGDLAICAAGCSVNAATFTLTAADPSSGGTWTQISINLGVSAAWQAGPGSASLYSCTWTPSSSLNADASLVTYKAAVAATVVPQARPVTWRRPSARARLGRLGLCAAGIASTVVTPLGAQQPHTPPVPVTRPAPHRAHTGPLGACGAGKAGPQPAAAAVPLTALPRWRPQPRRRVPARAHAGPLGLCAGGQPGPGAAFYTGTYPALYGGAEFPLVAAGPLRIVPRPAPRRARLGPRGLNAGGTAVPAAAAGTAATAYQRPSPGISRRLPQRALWRGLASRAITPRGSPSSPLPRPVIQHLPPDRARTGPAGRPWGGTASAAVTPLGSLQAPRRVVIAPPRHARAVTGHSQVAGGVAGPPGTVPPAAQAYQRPGPQVRRPGPARARIGPAGTTGDGVTGPANAQAAAAVSPPRLPPQARRPAPARGQWRGNASHAVTALGTAARRPGPQITSRPRTRALWRGIAGTIAPPVTALPRWRPLPSRRKPHRARTGGVRGLANALPPVVTYGTAVAGTMAIPAALAGQSVSAHADAGTGTAAEAAYGVVYTAAYGSPPGHAEAGQMSAPGAQAGQMTLPRAQ